MAYAVGRWEQLAASPNFTFDEYAGFLLTYPGFPDEDKLRRQAEDRLTQDYVAADRLIAYFDRFPPLTNNGRAQLAVAMMALRPDQAEAAARAAWRGGSMGETAFATLFATYGGRFTPEDHDARMDALLWQRDSLGAARQLPYVSPARSEVFAARLSILQGGDGATYNQAAMADPGYLYNRSRELRLEGRPQEAVTLLSARPALSTAPFDPTAWVEENLNVARLAGAGSAQQIALRASEAFQSEAAIVDGPYKLRDDYTSLMWLGGTRALWDLGNGNAAAPLFYRYGAAAKTPQTRSKGFFWAGRAAHHAGNMAEANRYYEMAAAYPEYFYGQLALEQLRRPIPALAAVAAPVPTPQQRAAFLATPLAQAIQTFPSAGYTWQTKRKFYTQIAGQARDASEMALVAELAQQLNLPELAVVVGRTAPEKGLTAFTLTGFPIVQTPPGADWTMVHAIARQESEFDDYRISHAGAQGLMQLMPGTAREQAGKIGVGYMSASLMQDLAVQPDARQQLLPADVQQLRKLPAGGGGLQRRSGQREQVAAGERRSAHWRDQLGRLDRTHSDLRDQELRRPGDRERGGLRAAPSRPGDRPPRARRERVPAVTAFPLAGAIVARQVTAMKPAENLITPAGLAALKARYDHLLGTERPEIVAIVSWAAGNGDRSENGDYLYGRKRMREIDRELAHLARRMKAARVIDPAQAPDRTKAWFGATVTIVDEDDNERTVTLVGDDEQDPSTGRIGWSAPIARALRGAAIGDLRVVRLPAGEKEWEVTAIEYPGALRETPDAQHLRGRHGPALLPRCRERGRRGGDAVLRPAGRSARHRRRPARARAGRPVPRHRQRRGGLPRPDRGVSSPRPFRGRGGGSITPPLRPRRRPPVRRGRSAACARAPGRPRPPGLKPEAN